MSLAAALMLILFFAWSAIGMPIGYAMIASAFVYLFLTGQDAALVASQSLNGLFRSFVLLAVPLFIVSAEIMNVAVNEMPNLSGVIAMPRLIVGLDRFHSAIVRRRPA